MKPLQKSMILLTLAIIKGLLCFGTEIKVASNLEGDRIWVDPENIIYQYYVDSEGKLHYRDMSLTIYVFKSSDCIYYSKERRRDNDIWAPGPKGSIQFEEKLNTMTVQTRVRPDQRISFSINEESNWFNSLYINAIDYIEEKDKAFADRAVYDPDLYTSSNQVKNDMCTIIYESDRILINSPVESIISLFDISGKMIYRDNTMCTNHFIPIISIKKGIYVLEVVSNTFTESHKIILK